MDRDRAALTTGTGATPSRRSASNQPASTRLGGLVGISLLLVMVVWPLVAILTRSFADVDAARIWEILGRPSLHRVLGFTFLQALASVVLTFAVGLPIAQLLARYRFRGRRLLRAVVIVPFVLPTVVVAAAFRSLFDQFGDLWPRGADAIPPLAAVLAAHVFFNVAVVVRVVGGYWATIDPDLESAARMLGAHGWGLHRRVTFPLLAPVLASAGVVVFLFCFTSYGIILILGGPGMATLETEIQRYAVFRGEFDVAGVLAVLQMLVVAGLAVAGSRVHRRRAGTASLPTPKPIVGLRRRLWFASVVALVGVVVVAPIATLVEQSLRMGNPGEARSYGLGHYRALFEPNSQLPVSAAQALAQSLGFAAVAATVAVGVGLVTARSAAAGGRLGRIASGLSVLPLGVSAVTLGFGYLLAFRQFDLRRSIWLIPVAHAVVGLPFVLAALRPALAAVDDRLRQVAATLGASPRDVRRRVEWPLVRRAMLTGAGFAAAISIGEFGATSFLSRGESGFTAPLAVFRLLARPGAGLRGQALALSVIIGVMVAALSFAVESVGERDRSAGQ